MRFYTLPPKQIPYPYVLINAVRPKVDYLVRYREFLDSVIIDSGVEMFRDPAVKDYPPNWFDRLAMLFKRVTSIAPHAKVWVTVPDYPDDYHPKALWVGGKTNIERTLDNIIYALTSYPEVRWLIPVQGHNRKPHSVVSALEMYVSKDIPLDKYIAIANLCVERSDKVMVTTVKLAHDWLMRNGIMPKIHVFGPDVSAIAKLSRYVYSFDSMAWTKPRVNGYWSAKNDVERIWLFITWIHKYANIIEIPYKIPKR